MGKYLNPKANVFVVETTGRWTAAIARNLPDAKVTRSLSLSRLKADCREFQYSAAVIELRLGKSAADAKNEISLPKLYETIFAGHSNESTRYFAVLDGWAGESRGERDTDISDCLIELGFTATINGIGEIERLRTMLLRHFDKTKPPIQSVENLFNSCLPW